MSDERIHWPPPKPDPPEEPSHHGAFLDRLREQQDEGWWERWLEHREEEPDGSRP